VIRSERESNNVRRVEGASPIKTQHIYPYDMAATLAQGEHCSLTERRADEATRDVVSWLKCEYLKDHEGDVFQGIVSSVAGFGLFVELSDLYVEGLVHVTNLAGDYYHFDPVKQRLIGERSGQIYQLGDKVTVQVARVNLDDRKVDLLLLATERKKRKSAAAYLDKDTNKGRDKKAKNAKKAKTRSKKDSVKKKSKKTGAKKTNRASRT
jgi:ribonuclease R